MILRFLIILNLLVVSGPAAAGAAERLPAGWRELTTSEASTAEKVAEAYYSGVEGRRGPRYEATGDFDGDGRPDRAVVLLNERKGAFALFVRRATEARYRKLAEGSDRSELWDWSLHLVEPGVYRSACGRGLGDSRAPCVPTIRNQWPGVAWGQNESGVAMFFWDGRRFAEEFLID